MNGVPRGFRARRATLGDQLRRHAQHQGGREAIVSLLPGGRRRAWTFAELDRDADRLAAFLQAAGIGRGDVVAISGRNTGPGLVAFYAAARLGAATTGVNLAFRPAEMEYQLKHSGARVLLAEPGPAEAIDGIRSRCPDLAVLLLDDSASPGAERPGWTRFEAAIEAASGPPPDPELEEDDAVLLTYTSGTEGRPKGIRLSHRNYLISTLPSFVEGMRLEPEDVWLYVLPFHTTAGLGSQIALLGYGNTLVIPYTVDVEETGAILERERVTVMSQTPTFYLNLIGSAGFRASDLTALRLCITYGGTMPQRMFDAMAAAAPGAGWCTFWSQSEISQTPIVGRFRDLADIPEEDASWIGRPTSQLEIKVVDEAGEVAEEGELLCRTPGLMLGYHRDAERTAAAFDDGGWLRTGDIVRRTADGDVFFRDRRSDIIKTGGMNVSSVEVERVLYRHPRVHEAAVVGIEDEYWSQAVTAFVVPDPDALPTEEELIAFCREMLAGFKTPKAVHFIDSLPKDGQGKILKRELRKVPEA